MQTFFGSVFELYRALLEPFRATAFGPTLATYLLALAIIVFLAFLCFAVTQAVQLRAAISAITKGSARGSEHEKRSAFRSGYDGADRALSSNNAVSRVWYEFRKTLTFPEGGSSDVVWGSARPYIFFTPRSLKVQYDLVRSLPNIFVGLGLLGTFIGLIAALTFSTESLTAASNQDEIKKALSELLTTAAAKFYISAAGLVASLSLSLLIRLTLKYLHSLVHQINESLQQRLLFLSEQDINQQQLLVQRDSLTELRFFNTNIAMKIGDAVRSAVETSNDALTVKLSEIANSFATLIDASGEGASRAVGDAMKGALESSLQQASEAISGVAAQLKELPDRLSAATSSIAEAGNAAAQQQERLAEDVREAAKSILAEVGSQIATNLSEGTREVMQDLQATGATFSDSAARIESFLAKFSDNGESYIRTLSSLGERNAEIEGKLSAIVSQISAAADGVVRAGVAVDGNLGKLLSGVSDVSRLLAETNRAAQDSQIAIRQTVEALQKQMALHFDRFSNVDERLAGVFTAISSHLELQAKQMGEQLTTMDQALASAVNQFEQLIEDLTAAMAARVGVV